MQWDLSVCRDSVKMWSGGEFFESSLRGDFAEGVSRECPWWGWSEGHLPSDGPVVVRWFGFICGIRSLCLFGEQVLR
jgi:hypothetical protein